MTTIAIRKISTSVLAMYFQVPPPYKVSLSSSGRKKLSMIKIFKFFVSDHLKSRTHQLDLEERD